LPKKFLVSDTNPTQTFVGDAESARVGEGGAIFSTQTKMRRCGHLKMGRVGVCCIIQRNVLDLT
jgi:hypothetical protein